MATGAGRVAVVTGGGSGIGEAYALRLAGEGFAVAILDVGRPGAERVAAAIHDGGGRAEVHVCDVADAAALGDVAVRVEAGLGPVEALVTAAAFDRPIPS